MGRSFRCVFVSLTAVVVVAGCGPVETRETKNKSPAGPKPSDWRGTKTVDPAGDLVLMQGRWRAVLADGTTVGIAEWYLDIEGEVLTSDFRVNQVNNPPPLVDKYQIILNSGHTPRIFRYAKRLTTNKPLVESPTSYWYTVDKDTLVLWNHWVAYGEGVRQYFRRDR